MKSEKTNRLAAFLTASAFAGVGFAVLPQMASAQTSVSSAKSHILPGTSSWIFPNPTQRAKSQKEWQKMIVTYHITPDQQTKIDKLGTELNSEMATVSLSKTLTDDQKKAQMISLASKSIEKMNAILTPEQRAKIKAVHEQRRMKQMQAAGAAGGMATKATK